MVTPLVLAHAVWKSKCAWNLLHSVNGVRTWTHGGLEARSRSGDMAYGGMEVWGCATGVAIWMCGGPRARCRCSDEEVV